MSRGPALTFKPVLPAVAALPLLLLPAGSNLSATAASQAASAPSVAPVLPLSGGEADYDPLITALGEARFILLGEATHGTAEFYGERARISERLLREGRVLAVAIEADWPKVDRVNRYVRGYGADRSADEALSDLGEFPAWMWRNAEFAAFVEALRAHNLALPPEQRTGLYGMDSQDLFAALDGAVESLSGTNPQAAAQARADYACFDRYRRDQQRYGREAYRTGRSCERAVTAVLERLSSIPAPSEAEAAEARFAAVRNAAAAVHAEAYIRAAYAGANGWNVRDTGMAETVTALAERGRDAAGGPGRVIVWAHNSHVGDARATAVPWGQVTLGQLLRERHGAAAFLVGFLTHSGSVVAAAGWDEPGRSQRLRPALPDSDAGRLHERGLDRALVLLRGAEGDPDFATRRLQRAVGVVYQPDTERLSHYYQAELARQFDAVVYLDRTEGVTPLRRPARPQRRAAGG